MKSVDPSVYTKEYYLQHCLGSAEFNQHKGLVLHSRLENLLKKIKVSKNAKILDIGCGRGDITLYMAKKGKVAIGIDYAKSAISIANKVKGKAKIDKNKLQFKQMNVKKLQFSDNYFDIVIGIDILEHLYKDEAEIAMQEIVRVLKPNGLFFVHTGPNKYLYDFIYPRYILPMNKWITKIDQIIKRKKYSSLPDDPRTQIEKEQHVNEPTYFYLKYLFKKYHLSGGIQIDIGYLKQGDGIRTRLYNALVTLYPLSKITPLKYFFGWVFIGYLHNEKN